MKTRIVSWLDRIAGWWFGRRSAGAVDQIAAESGVRLRRVSMLPGEYRFDLIAPGLICLIDEAAAMLNAQRAENYIQFEMLPRSDRTKNRPIRVTIQWMHGESPAQQNDRLRTELAAAEARERTALIDLRRQHQARRDTEMLCRAAGERATIAEARAERLRGALEAAQALEAFYIDRAWAMQEDEASRWAAFAAARAALEAQP